MKTSGLAILCGLSDLCGSVSVMNRIEVVSSQVHGDFKAAALEKTRRNRPDLLG